MRPITRETIVDRRQPSLRWGAVFAGATVAVALWVLLQLIGMGVGLTAVNLDDSGSLRSVGIGTTVSSMLAPLIAMFVGGIVGARMSGTFDTKVGASHGFIIWSVSSLAGVLAVAWLIATLAKGTAMHMHYEQMPTAQNVALDPDLRANQLAVAADKTGKILLGTGITLLVSLLTALAGGALGARRLVRASAERTEKGSDPISPSSEPAMGPVTPSEKL
jgi:hypothetical protein